MEGDPRSVRVNVRSSLSSCFSPSVLIGDNISGALISSSISVRLDSRCRVMCVSAEPAGCESDGGGVGCWETSGAGTSTPSWESSVVLQEALSSSGGHEECNEVVVAMFGVGILHRRQPGSKEG